MSSSLHRRIGQLALVGFDGFSIPPEVRSLAREFDLGGVVLFGRNVESPEQVAAVAWEARQLSRDLPLWVGVDQEGGRVARMRRPLTEWPPAITLGRAASDDLAERFARALAAELAAVGISIDFAPVLDVLTNKNNPVIGDRALAETPESAARLGALIIRGLQGGGVAACGKHFPGHGESSVDSHLELPILDLSPERLRAVELLPFRAAIAAGVAGIMTGHLLVPALDEARPATISPAIVTGLLRQDLGFEGVVFTDDLDMKGIAGELSREQAFVAQNQGSSFFRHRVSARIAIERCVHDDSPFRGLRDGRGVNLRTLAQRHDRNRHRWALQDDRESSGGESEWPQRGGRSRPLGQEAEHLSDLPRRACHNPLDQRLVRLRAHSVQNAEPCDPRLREAIDHERHGTDWTTLESSERGDLTLSWIQLEVSFLGVGIVVFRAVRESPLEKLVIRLAGDGLNGDFTHPLAPIRRQEHPPTDDIRRPRLNRRGLHQVLVGHRGQSWNHRYARTCRAG
jgi:beta-N-acetylhexosaminidase